MSESVQRDLVRWIGVIALAALSVSLVAWLSVAWLWSNDAAAETLVALATVCGSGFTVASGCAGIYGGAAMFSGGQPRQAPAAK